MDEVEIVKDYELSVKTYYVEEENLQATLVKSCLAKFWI